MYITAYIKTFKHQTGNEQFKQYYMLHINEMFTKTHLCKISLICSVFQEIYDDVYIVQLIVHVHLKLVRGRC